MPEYDYRCKFCGKIYTRECKMSERNINIPKCWCFNGYEDCELIISKDTTTRHTWSGLAGRGLGRGIEK